MSSRTLLRAQSTVQHGDPPVAPRRPRQSRSGRRPGVAVLPVLAGVVGTAVGLGIGVRHLQVAGPSLLAVAGLASLVAGLVALIAGGIELVGSLRSWRKLLAVPVGLLAIWFLLWPLTAALMATNVPPTSLGTETPANRGLAYEDVDLLTSDDVRLSAWYVPSRNRAAVALLHGATSTRSNVLDEAAVLADHGYGVLLVDARGHGRSEGVAMDWGWYGDLDIGAAVSYLSERPDVNPERLGVVGMSMGGEEAIGAAATNDAIRAVVAEGASSRVTVDDDDLILPDHAGRWFNIGQTWIQRSITDALTGARPPLALREAVVATAPRPVLLITGSNALGGEVSAGPRLRDASPDNVELWEVPGASHIAGLATAPDEWEIRVITFLDRALAEPLES